MPRVPKGEGLGPHCSESPRASIHSQSLRTLSSLNSPLSILQYPWSASSALKQFNSLWAPQGTRESLISKLKIPLGQGKGEVSPTDLYSHELKPRQIISWHLPCFSSLRPRTISLLQSLSSFEFCEHAHWVFFLSLWLSFLSPLCSALP